MNNHLRKELLSRLNQLYYRRYFGI